MAVPECKPENICQMLQQLGSDGPEHAANACSQTAINIASIQTMLRVKRCRLFDLHLYSGVIKGVTPVC